MTDPLKLFISYSHDSETHKDWVLTLATRLVKNGVDVILDQWDLSLGDDLPRFMEQGLSKAQRVLVICTNDYVKKVNEGQNGGASYEKRILTAQLFKESFSSHIIPVVRDNDYKENPLPVFLGTSLYIDFRDDLKFEEKYGDLIRNIHGQKVKPKPPIGPNPFANSFSPKAPIVSFGPERYVAPAMTGEVSFDYSNNNGRFVFGAGDMAFETAWSKKGKNCIYGYNDPPSIYTVALVDDTNEIIEIADASMYDTSSRARSPYLGQILVWQNTAGYYLATKVIAIEVRNQDGGVDKITLEYRIAPNKSTSFSAMTDNLHQQLSNNVP